MRKGQVFYSDRLAGVIAEVSPTEYVFRYDNEYFADATAAAISLSLPKNQQEYRSPHLFSFFFNMLSEGKNREVQSRLLHIDADDDFGILLATAGYDTPGCVTIRPLLD